MNSFSLKVGKEAAGCQRKHYFRKTFFKVRKEAASCVRQPILRKTTLFLSKERGRRLPTATHFQKKSTFL